MAGPQLSEIPRYECLREAARHIPGADPSLCELFLSILLAGELAARCEAGFLQRHGLNLARLTILVILDSAGTGSQRSSELADRAGVSRATMTGLLDTMEKARLVARAPDPHDRRATNVKITPAGEKLVRRVQPLQSEWMKGLLAPLSEHDREELVRLLTKARQSLAAAGCPSVPD